MIKKILPLIMIILILIFGLSSVSVYAENVDDSHSVSAIPLRAGGGGGGGGGSGGGGGGTTHHSGSGRQPTLLESVIQFVTLPLVLFSSSILFYIKLTKRSRNAKKLMKQMMQSDNAWKYQDISATVKDSFMAIQTAWANMDLSPAAQYMSDELYDSFQMKLNWMSFRNEKNILKNIQLLQALPVAVHDDCDNSRDYIWFYVKGKMVDYIIDADTQMKISGNTFATSFVEYWQFTRRENDWILNQILQKNESDQIPFAE